MINWEEQEDLDKRLDEILDNKELDNIRKKELVEVLCQEFLTNNKNDKHEE